MKYLDWVRLTSDKYENEGVKKGQTGTIIDAEIRDCEFFVCFEPKVYDGSGGDILVGINVGDLVLLRESKITDDDILEAVPLNDPNWWCKVEDGYILNLKGERKNKIPYDYRS